MPNYLLFFRFNDPGKIPDTNGLIAAGGRQIYAVGTKGYPASNVIVLQRQKTRSCRYFPHFDRLIIRRTRQ